MSLHRPLPAAVAAIAAAAILSACGTPAASVTTGATGADGATDAAIAVDAGDTTCTIATTTLPAGRHTFQVTNTASQITEVYVYAPGDQIMGEVENVGPSTQRTLIVDLPAGDYEVTYKPGMVGNGIRTALTITGDAAPSMSL